MEEHYAKFIDMIKEVRINVPLVNVLPDIPNYRKFLKDIVSKKSKMEKISAAFLNEECSTTVQNKLPPKLDFVILEIEEDNKVPLILGRPFLHIVDAIIKVKSKELNKGVGDDRITFIIDKAMQHSYSNDDTCFHMDVIDEVTKEELDALLNDFEPFLSTSRKIIETSLDKEFDEFMAIYVEEILKKEEEINDNFEE
nr:reverse transcriptase domain-containing protein [Tanacetum cinerariifolium]